MAPAAKAEQRPCAVTAFEGARGRGDKRPRCESWLNGQAGRGESSDADAGAQQRLLPGKLVEMRASGVHPAVMHMQVLAARVCCATAIAWLAVNVSWADGKVEEAWAFLREQWWFQHDSFEPVWATLSFAAAIWLFAFVDRLLPLKAYLVNPEHRKVERDTGVPVRAGAVYLGVIMAFDTIYPRRVLPKEGPAGLVRVVAAVVTGLFAYDLAFFPIHLAMHRVRGLAKFHVQHHSARALFSTEVLRHSLLDGALQVGTNILVLNVLKLHPFERMVYNSVITYLLTETHSGYDLPWMLHNLVPFGVLGGPPRHEVHHKVGTRNFQQFFTYLDDWLQPRSAAHSLARAAQL